MRAKAFWIGAASALLLAGAAQAQGRPDTLNMTCAQAQAMVVRSGAVVLSTGPNLYDRYVTALRYCSPGQQLAPSWVRSADNPQCYIYNRCVDSSFTIR